MGSSLEQGKLDARRFRKRHYERSLELARNAYYSHREERLAKIAEKYKLEREWFQALKNKPCLDCGQSWPPCVMEFDHVRGIKKRSVGNMLGRLQSRKAILREIAKCDLVCANCHRIRTHLSGRPLRGNSRKERPTIAGITRPRTFIPGAKDEE